MRWFLLKKLSKFLMRTDCSQKLGVIKAELLTLNANPKIKIGNKLMKVEILFFFIYISYKTYSTHT